MPDYSRAAYKEGAAARRAGKPRGANPYSKLENAVEWDAWDSGWQLG